MKKQFNRVCSLLLAVLLVFQTIPVDVWATENETAIAETLEETETATAENAEDEDAENVSSETEATEVEFVGTETVVIPAANAVTADSEKTDKEETEESETETTETASGEMSVEMTEEIEEILDSFGSEEEQLEMYMQMKLLEAMGGGVSLFGTTAGDLLSGSQKNVYDALKLRLKAIADGTEHSTEIAVSAGLEDFTCTKEEINGDSFVNGSYVSDEAGKVLANKINLSKLVNTLLTDLPYELYWFDKTVGIRMGYSTQCSETELRITDITFKFSVASAYRASAEDAYTTNTLPAKVTTATEKAAKIVEDNANLSDDGKLTAYKNEICTLVDYNSDAADKTIDTPYGDPWQLIYVFDGDENTKVVCEGYAKAFQYLCDLSTFHGDVTCYTVTGWMGTEPHMWNIVEKDGYRYLVDVTNSDDGSVGQSGGLFMVSNPTMYASGTYTFQVDSEDIVYQYEGSMGDLVTDTGYPDLGIMTPETVDSAEGFYQALKNAAAYNKAYENKGYEIILAKDITLTADQSYEIPGNVTITGAVSTNQLTVNTSVKLTGDKVAFKNIGVSFTNKEIAMDGHSLIFENVNVTDAVLGGIGTVKLEGSSKLLLPSGSDLSGITLEMAKDTVLDARALAAPELKAITSNGGIIQLTKEETLKITGSVSGSGSTLKIYDSKETDSFGTLTVGHTYVTASADTADSAFVLAEGHKYPENISAKFVCEKTGTAANWAVKEIIIVAATEVNGVQAEHETLEAAFAAVQNGGTLTLQKSGETLNWTDNDHTYTVNGAITLNLGNHTFKLGNDTKIQIPEGSLTVSGGSGASVGVTGENENAAILVSGGTLNWNGGSCEADIQVSESGALCLSEGTFAKIAKTGGSITLADGKAVLKNDGSREETDISSSSYTLSEITVTEAPIRILGVAPLSITMLGTDHDKQLTIEVKTSKVDQQLTYQWYAKKMSLADGSFDTYGASKVGSAKTDILTLNPESSGDLALKSGETYQFYCEVSAGSYKARSTPVTVTVVAGQLDGTLTFSENQPVYGDTLTVTYTSTDQENISTFQILLNGQILRTENVTDEKSVNISIDESFIGKKISVIATDVNGRTATGVVPNAVGKKPLTVNENSKPTVAEKIYDGTTNAVVTSKGTLDGMIDSETVDFTVAAKFTDKNAGENKTVNLTYTLNGELANRYEAPTGATVTADIEKLEASLVWEALDDLIYDRKEKVPSVKVGNAVSGDDVSVSAKVTDGNSNRNAGSFTFTATGFGGTDAGNYQLPKDTQSGEYVIQEASMTDVQVSQKDSLTYNGQEQTPTVTATEETATGETITYQYGLNAEDINGYQDNVPAVKDAETYTIYYTASADNYQTVKGSFHVTVGKLKAVLKWNELADPIYDNQKKVPVVEVSNKAAADEVFVNIQLTEGQDNVHIGKFTFTATGLSGDDSANYELQGKEVSRDYTIMSATMGDLAVAQSGSLIYNGESQKPAVTVTQETATEEEITYLYGTAEGYYGTEMPAFETAGTHTVYYKASADNYHDKIGSFAVTIDKKKVTLQWTAPSDLTYDGQPKVPTVALGGVIAGDDVQAEITLHSGDNVIVGPFDYKATGLTGKDGNNYKLPDAESERLSHSYSIIVAALPNDITVEQKGTLTYNGAAQKPNVTVSLEKTATDQDVIYYYDINENVGDSTTLPEVKEAGEYTVYFKASAQYYGQRTGSFKVKVDKAPLTITTAQLQAKTYDATADAEVSSVTFEGLFDPDALKINADYTASAVFDDAKAGSGKTADITVTLENTELTKNYELSEKKFKLEGQTIAQAAYSPIPTKKIDIRNEGIRTGTLTLEELFGASMIPDGAEIVSVTAPTDPSVMKEVKASDDQKGISYTSNMNQKGTATEEEYAVKVSSTNYQDFEIRLTFKAVDKIPAVITGVTAKTGLVYHGEAQAGYTGTPSSAYTGEYQISYKGTEKDGSVYASQNAPKNAGNYAVVFKVPEEDLTYTGSLEIPFEIGQKEVSLEWTAPVGLVYDGAAKEPKVSLEGLCGSDKVDVSTALKSGNNTNAGDFTFEAIGLTGADKENYKLPAKVESDTYTIQPAKLSEITITQNGALIYNGAEQSLTISVETTATAAITYEYSKDGITYSTEVPTVKDAGVHKIYFKATAANYESKEDSFNVLIGKKDLTISNAVLGEKTYDGTKTAEVTSVTFDGVVGSDSLTIGKDYTASAVFDNADVGPGKTADITVTLKETETTKNYNLPVNTFTLKGQEIIKRTYPHSVTKEIIIKNEGVRTGTLTLTDLFGAQMIPDDAKVVDVTAPAEPKIMKTVEETADGLNVSYTSLENAKSTTSSDVYLVKVFSRNYAEFEIALTFKAEDKTPVTITGVEAAEGLVYNGTKQSGYTGTPASDNYTGTYTVTYSGTDGTVYSSDDAPVNAGSYKATIQVPADDAVYAGKLDVNFTIHKKQLSWDVSGLSASKRNDNNNEVTVYGELKLTGFAAADTAGDSLPIAFTPTTGFVTSGLAGKKITGTYDVEAVLTSGSIVFTPDNPENYILPSGNPQIKAVVNAVTYLGETPPEPSQDPADQLKVEMETGISAVPSELVSKTDPETGKKLDTPKNIEDAIHLRVEKKLPAEQKSNIAVYDVTLMVSEDGGVTWTRADENHWPEDGKLTVTLPYPSGTGQHTHKFTVAHMFTSTEFGKTPGEFEYPATTNTEKGVQFQVTGFSPIALGWEEIPQSGSSGGSGSSEEEDASKGEGSVDSVSVPAATTAAPTGDSANIGLWIAAAFVAAVTGVSAYYADRRRKK